MSRGINLFGGSGGSPWGWPNTGGVLGDQLPGVGTLDFGCAMLIDRNDLPKHLFGIPDLYVSDDLCDEHLV